MPTPFFLFVLIKILSGIYHCGGIVDSVNTQHIRFDIRESRYGNNQMSCLSW